MKVKQGDKMITARLPPEVLSTIFRYLVVAGVYPTRPGHRNIHWIQVTHVCTHWRRVALDCPDLWTIDIPLSLPKLAKEMLNRSKMAPLTIATTVFPEKCLHPKSINSTLADSMIRIQTFSNRALIKPAPLLKSFSIYCAESSPDMLPKGIFSGEAPRLREVALGNCTLDWDEPFLSTLKLESMSILHSARLSMDGLMSVLSRMPDLRTLVLRDAFLLQIPLYLTASTTGS